MEVNSWNEWDPLEEVIIGTARNARVPQIDKSLLAINYAGQTNHNEIPVGPYPDKVINEAEEDLEILCTELVRLGVKVVRPEPNDTSIKFSNGHWSSEGYYNFCPRDSVLIHGNNIIETPMPLRSRYIETDVFKGYFQKAAENGARWEKAPKPKLLDHSYDTDNVSRDTLTLLEDEPCFDAANVLRAGYDLFYLVSNSGNKRGAVWLQNYLGSEFKVHLIEKAYSYMHIDSTVSLLRPGLALLNPSRMKEHHRVGFLKNWDIIWCDEPVDIGYFGPYKNASTWIGMNLLMVNPDLAIVEKNQNPLIKQLEQKKINVLPLPMRHARTLGGAFHCVSLDVRRKGKLEKYD